MVRVLFLPAARLDVIEARDWYAARGAGLGEAFVAEIDRQILHIVEAPLRAPVMLADVRRVLLR
jgi:plasmid stabilization system protein ParE